LTQANLKGEIIVVDDGSKDNTAAAAKSAKVPLEVSPIVIHYEPHRGKGYAVQTGIERTQGRYVMFADSGSTVPYNNALRGLELIKSGTCDIAHGSRKIPAAAGHIQKAQGLYRRICSNLFHWFVAHYIGVPAEFTDTQCGFKIYRGEVARHLYGECITDGFAFDIEIVMRAQKQGYRIKEFPVDWTCDRDSRLSLSRSLWRTFSELKNIKKVLSDTSPKNGMRCCR
jgi:dolichyl-phosphate beta-glucosyltransferase